jgi:hypothetical protein
MLPVSVRRNCRPIAFISFLLTSCVFLLAPSALASPFKSNKDESPGFVMQVEAPPADVIKAVEQVTQDQIIHGTYSYDKERILYGAHSASAAHVFGVWKGQGQAYYKVDGGVLAPRNFKDSGDIGTISVRYVVQQIAPTTMTIRIDAVFVDARNLRHPSLGTVESSEFGAIQQQIKNIDAARREALSNPEGDASARAQSSQQPTVTAPAAAAAHEEVLPAPTSVPDLQKQIAALRRQVELRVRDQGAQLKSAPFHSAATLQSLAPQSDVVVVILSPYWYGVETEDGHRGWIHHSQLEPLP